MPVLALDQDCKPIGRRGDGCGDICWTAVEPADLGDAAHNIDMGESAAVILAAADRVDMPPVIRDQHHPAGNGTAGRRTDRNPGALVGVERQCYRQG